MIQYPTIKPEIRSEFTIFSTFRILLNHSDMRTALKISLIYLGCCSTYILFSDQIIARLFTSPQELTFIQSIKGITFVIGSSILIYVLVRYYISKSLDAEKRSEDVSEYYRLVFENNPLVASALKNSSKLCACELALGEPEREIHDSCLLIGAL